jgi:hypothetical protein
LYGEYPLEVKFQNSEFAFMFLDPQIITNSAVKF